MINAVIGIAAGLLFLGPVQVQAQTWAIVGATIIDGNGGPVIPNGTVLIEGDRIAAIGDRSIAVPKRARTVDAQGKYVIPGLMDANVHLLIDVRLENLVRFEDRYTDLILEAAQVALKYGVTTVFDSWGPLQPLAEARRRINEGLTSGSRIYFAGNIIGFGGPFTQDFSGAAAKIASHNLTQRINELWEEDVGRELLWLPAEQLRDVMRSYVAKGVDFVKYGVSGHTFGEKQFILFSDAAQRAIVEETHRAGITAQSHTYSVESVRMALDAGVDLLQHCELTGPIAMPDSLIRRMIDKKVYCAVLPHTEERLAHFRQLRGDARIGEHFGVTYQVADRNIKQMVQAGAPLLLSTDAGLTHRDAASDEFFKRFYGDRKDVLMDLGVGHFAWLRAMEEKGMRPMHMLLASTREVARAYKVDESLGTLERGKIADLLVLDSNPLESAGNYRAIRLVVKDGRIVDRDALPAVRLLSE